MFDPNADPESIAARAAELSLEQLDRLRSYLKRHPDKGVDFLREPFEISISNQVVRLMGAYAVLKGYVTAERAGVQQ
jgi:hypothetical protein